jgi:protoporphyrinogen oxidase
MRVVILGGGPCGLGAAWRLNEIGHEDWLLFEADDHWGGLSSSFTDKDGFVWDIGGHVLFSHYAYFDGVMDTLLGKKEGWSFHRREAWIRMQDRFVPYPLQQNIHYLPREIYWECLEGIIDVHKNGHKRRPGHFGEWIDMTFGKGLARWFLRPYNYKVWGYPVEELDWTWIGERVAPVDLKSVLKNAIFQKSDESWGPNAQFRFPLHGGTGRIWETLASRLPHHRCRLRHKVTGIDLRKKLVNFGDGTEVGYDVLLSTISLKDLVNLAELESPFDRAVSLKHSSCHIIGLAIRGNPPESLATKCWIYFPEDFCPFYRATVFSNYSPHNVPDINTHWSLMCEVSESPRKEVNRHKVVENVIDGALRTGLLKTRRELDHTWCHSISYAYPTPSLGRDRIIIQLIRKLEEYQIFSRGRFGAWRYEVGNMDHSFMQGVELVGRLFESKEEMTLWHPEKVNAPTQKIFPPSG